MKTSALRRFALLASVSIGVWFTPQTLHAQWSFGLEGGTVFRDSGNATQLRLKLQNRQRPLNHYLYADWLRSGDSDDSYELGYLPRYWFDNHRYLFGEAYARVDTPLSIDLQRRVTLGAGYVWQPNRASSLQLEAGVGRRHTEFVDSLETDDTHALLRAGLRRQFGQQLRLELDLDALAGESLTQTTAVVALALKMPTGALRVGYRVRRLDADSSPAVDDEDFIVGLGYGF